MSMETHVFFRGKMPSKPALSRALKQLGFPYTIKPVAGSLEKQSGYMPMMLWDEETGVEFEVLDEPSDIAEFANVGVDPSFDRVANFRWGGNMQECGAGMCCAAALAKLLNGVVFDEAEGKLFSPDEAAELARKYLVFISKPKTSRVGTKPGDIKRFLKSLLSVRSDLVMVGRTLVIRPVRHFLRGAYFARTGDRYAFEIRQYLHPLFHADSDLGVRHPAGGYHWNVYEPQVEYLVFDSLADRVFDGWSRLTAFSDIIDEAHKTRPMNEDDRFDALVLSGQIEDACTFVNDIERRRSHDSSWRDWARNKKQVLESGISTLCEEHHRKEAAAAKAMKLGDIWEASPFPVEVSGADRAGRTDEPAFPTAPWVTLPTELWRELPSQPGETVFARWTVGRKDRRILWKPLTLQEAEERHQTLQQYYVATRLTDGTLAIVNSYTLWDPHRPKPIIPYETIHEREYFLEIHVPPGEISASFSEEIGKAGILRLTDVWIRNVARTKRYWSGHNVFYFGERSTWDDRTDETIRKFRVITGSDLVRLTVQRTSIDGISVLIRCVRDYLSFEGVDNHLNSMSPAIFARQPES
jgi:hypothetical protein